jgi:O-antigen/teichoic acid export membrane protein
LSFFPLWLNAVVVILYTKVDQIILTKYLGLSELGRYVASTQISSIVVIPVTAFLASKLSGLINLKKKNEFEFNNKIVSITVLIFLISILWKFFLTISSSMIISMVYGSKFSGSSIYVILYSLCLIFNCSGMVAGQWVIVEKLYWIPIFRSIYGLILNILLNVLLIPKYGIIGACISAFVTSFITNFILYYFSKKGKALFFLQIKALKNLFNIKFISFGLR